MDINWGFDSKKLDSLFDELGCLNASTSSEVPEEFHEEEDYEDKENQGKCERKKSNIDYIVEFPMKKFDKPALTKNDVVQTAAYDASIHAKRLKELYESDEKNKKPNYNHAIRHVQFYQHDEKDSANHPDTTIPQHQARKPSKSVKKSHEAHERMVMRYSNDSTIQDINIERKVNRTKPKNTCDVAERLYKLSYSKQEKARRRRNGVDESIKSPNGSQVNSKSTTVLASKQNLEFEVELEMMRNSRIAIGASNRLYGLSQHMQQHGRERRKAISNISKHDLITK